MQYVTAVCPSAFHGVSLPLSGQNVGQKLCWKDVVWGAFANLEDADEISVFGCSPYYRGDLQRF